SVSMPCEYPATTCAINVILPGREPLCEVVIVNDGSVGLVRQCLEIVKELSHLIRRVLTSGAHQFVNGVQNDHRIILVFARFDDLWDEITRVGSESAKVPNVEILNRTFEALYIRKVHEPLLKKSGCNLKVHVQDAPLDNLPAPPFKPLGHA